MSGKIYIATETFTSAHDANIIRKGVTRVREGHILLQHHPMFFAPLGEDGDDRVNFEADSVREPTTPAQVREPEVDTAPALEDMTRKDLEALAEELGVENPTSFANKPALIAAIQAQ